MKLPQSSDRAAAPGVAIAICSLAAMAGALPTDDRLALWSATPILVLAYLALVVGGFAYVIWVIAATHSANPIADNQSSSDRGSPSLSSEISERTMTAFVFDPKVFVQPGYEQADGDWSDECRAQIDLVRDLHPELASWGRLAVGCAWGSYSQDIMAVGWLYPGQGGSGRTAEFLAYCYICQVAPGFDFGGTGLYSEDIYQLAKQEPWLRNEHTVPAWARN